MNFKKVLLALSLLSVFTGLGLLAWFVYHNLKAPKPGGLQVNSIPKAAVYLNGQQLGQTPFTTEKIEVGEYTLKLVPIINTNGQTWESRIKIESGVLTYVGREIETTSGQTLTLEKLPSRSTELSVVSEPDKAAIIIDGLEKGQTPNILTAMTPGDHVVTISSSGYADIVIQANFIAGYRLNALVQLHQIGHLQMAAKQSTEELLAASSSASIARIKDTPLGFLRVRFAPDIAASEAGKVYPTQEYKIVSQTEGWTKIILPNGEGWVSDAYVEVLSPNNVDNSEKREP